MLETLILEWWSKILLTNQLINEFVHEVNCWMRMSIHKQKSISYINLMTDWLVKSILGHSYKQIGSHWDVGAWLRFFKMLNLVRVSKSGGELLSELEVFNLPMCSVRFCGQTYYETPVNIYVVLQTVELLVKFESSYVLHSSKLDWLGLPNKFKNWSISKKRV